MDNKTAVVVVDFQGDFTSLEKGFLAVAGTDKSYVDEVNKAVKGLRKAGFPIIATQDWHPKDHMSFFTNTPGKEAFDLLELDDGRDQVLWPPHCVQNTKNAGILLDEDLLDGVIKKGTDPKYDSYSGFFDDGGIKTGLEDLLIKKGIKTLLVFGLAADYCVRATVLDGIKQGFGVILVRDLCRGVAEETTRAALEQMEAAGAVLLDRLPDNLSDMAVSSLGHF